MSLDIIMEIFTVIFSRGRVTSIIKISDWKKDGQRQLLEIITIGPTGDKNVNTH
jgi:hypothetical protein